METFEKDMQQVFTRFNRKRKKQETNLKLFQEECEKVTSVTLNNMGKVVKKFERSF